MKLSDIKTKAKCTSIRNLSLTLPPLRSVNKNGANWILSETATASSQPRSDFTSDFAPRTTRPTLNIYVKFPRSIVCPNGLKLSSKIIDAASGLLLRGWVLIVATRNSTERIVAATQLLITEVNNEINANKTSNPGRYELGASLDFGIAPRFPTCSHRSHLVGNHCLGVHWTDHVLQAIHSL